MDSIHGGHRERLRARFLSEGLEHMEPHNALELLLTCTIPRRDVNELAHRLLHRFGGFDKVLEADRLALMEVEGVGEATATHLKLVFASFAYYEAQKYSKGFVASSSGAVLRYAQSLFVGQTAEVAYLLCFDAKLKLNNRAELSQGTVGATGISVRRVVELATLAKAASVILAHNHPSGIAMPSAEDLATTKTVMQALAYIEIPLVDHIIVGERSAISMADAGVLYNMREELGLR